MVVVFSFTDLLSPRQTLRLPEQLTSAMFDLPKRLNHLLVACLLLAALAGQACAHFEFKSRAVLRPSALLHVQPSATRGSNRSVALTSDSLLAISASNSTAHVSSALATAANGLSAASDALLFALDKTLVNLRYSASLRTRFMITRALALSKMLRNQRRRHCPRDSQLRVGQARAVPAWRRASRTRCLT